MESKFPQRVRLERTAISRVNEALSGLPQLVGLSDSAVDRWIHSLVNTNRFDPDKLKMLKGAIRGVALAARSEADVSDEVFVDVVEDDASAALAGLARALRDISDSI